MSSKISYETRESAFGQRVFTFVVVNRDHSDVEEFFDDAFFHFEKSVRETLSMQPSVKVNTIFRATFEKPYKNNQQQGEGFLNEHEPSIDLDPEEA